MKCNKYTMMFMSLALAMTAACGKSDKGGSGGGGGGGGGLEMASSSAACKAAMTCCEEMVKAKTGKATPEEINLSCSGVAMAKTDADCGEFKKGYAASLEGAGKPLPDACK